MADDEQHVSNQDDDDEGQDAVEGEVVGDEEDQDEQANEDQVEEDGAEDAEGDDSDSDSKFVSGVKESPEEIEKTMQERWVSGISEQDRNTMVIMGSSAQRRRSLE